ncbi:MAG: hypothetical protein SVX43_03710 [Cyanobacteriota bacterium]|nr:hypothetical protein [Cyanobacteriota bacterium]
MTQPEEPQKPISTSAQPVTYYVDHHITRVLCNTYGPYWEDMRKTSKLTFRAALSSYSLCPQKECLHAPRRSHLQAHWQKPKRARSPPPNRSS